MQNLPCHIAIIPDGNRRWAKERSKPGPEGYLEGVKRFREISKAAFEMGIKYFTFWAASIDNLTKRNPEEVKSLVYFLKQELANERVLEMCRENQIYFRMSGDWDNILKDDELSNLVTALKRRTMLFEKHCLTLLFGYSGKQEMLRVIQDFCNSVLERRWLSSPEDINEELVNKFLGNLPSVDLLIRTGACEEGPNWSHNSLGFMMWLAADAKVYSPPTLWPDFTVEMFRKAVVDYSGIPRRFGA